MNRILLALPLLMLAAAAPAPGIMPMPEAEFAMATPRVAIEPDAVTTDLQSAPIPNVLTALPATIADDDADSASLSPRVYHQNEQFQGNGFSSGSSVQSSQQRGQHPALGIGLNIPVQ